MPKLYDLAHCRAGDKGNTSILSLIAYRAEDFPLLRERVTADAVKRHLARHHQGRGHALRAAATSARCNSSCEHALGGGVTTSLALDAHGKSLSSALLEMEIEI